MTDHALLIATRAFGSGELKMMSYLQIRGAIKDNTYFFSMKTYVVALIRTVSSKLISSNEGSQHTF